VRASRTPLQSYRRGVVGTGECRELFARIQPVCASTGGWLPCALSIYPTPSDWNSSDTEVQRSACSEPCCIFIFDRRETTGAVFDARSRAGSTVCFRSWRRQSFLEDAYLRAFADEHGPSGDATHTSDTGHPVDTMPTFPITLPLTHPAYTLADSAAEERAGGPQPLGVAAAPAHHPAEASRAGLPEPPAFDARAEYEVFVQFNQLIARRRAVVISPRFSTVRMAERLVVLGEGRVIEEGTYEELLAREGSHAELFEMQRAGYR
jgi:hypothetical protein